MKRTQVISDKKSKILNSRLTNFHSLTHTKKRKKKILRLIWKRDNFSMQIIRKKWGKKRKRKKYRKSIIIKYFVCFFFLIKIPLVTSKNEFWLDEIKNSFFSLKSYFSKFLKLQISFRAALKLCLKQQEVQKGKKTWLDFNWIG